VENLVEDFAQLLVRYSKPVESRSEPEKGEIAARISVLLEDFYKPVGDSNDLNSEEKRQSPPRRFLSSVHFPEGKNTGTEPSS
jgi:hypothetical protein